jgi:hypothetical protein
LRLIVESCLKTNPYTILDRNPGSANKTTSGGVVAKLDFGAESSTDGSDEEFTKLPKEKLDLPDEKLLIEDSFYEKYPISLKKEEREVTPLIFHSPEEGILI